ncbi:hypothetical protein AK830_g8093 [Neonectria ditissima]|uniref:DUF7708 domain-containing protein n=1 Tax=Neonectria ditissima TaxID=78410 RepID=A0A0N8H6A9_9HYPO|nr:hypothetical protein AK830_g8093 [Neonectria ditissima]
MATAHYVDPEPGALVQRFSWEIEARERTEADTEEFDQLRSDFISERERREKERRENIRRIEEQFSVTRSDDVLIFNKAKKQLREVMGKFQDLVPGQLKTDGSPTSWEDIWSAATEAQTQWETRAKETRVGQVKHWVRRMCNGMNNHSTALKMLPSESEYVSLVAGSVSMIIKASANYINISESFARGIVDVNDAVNLEHLSHVYDTPILQQLTMRLYVQIFTYLIKFMTWYMDRSRKRFLRSFNENINRLFEDDLNQVKQISNLLSRQIQMYMSADARVSKLMLEDLSGDMRYLLKLSETGERQSRLRDAANPEVLQRAWRCHIEKTKEEVRECVQEVMKDYQEMMRRSISGNGITNLLEQQASRDSPVATQFSLIHRAQDPEDNYTLGQSRTGSTEELNQEAMTEAIDIRFESRHFEDYFTWDHVHPESETPLPLLADATFLGRLDYFTTSMESTVLYAHGQYQDESTNLLRQSVSAYASHSQEAGVPVVSYFCQLPHDEPPEHRSRESIDLSALLYAMIRQVVNLLPVGASRVSLDAEIFSTLDGTLRTWQEAIALFEHLVSCVELPLLLFVIDGINVLEDQFEHSTDEALENLVRCLARMTNPAAVGEERMVKVLFTTMGLSETLCRLLDREDMVSCSTSSPRGARRMPRARRVISS